MRLLKQLIHWNSHSLHSFISADIFISGLTQQPIKSVWLTPALLLMQKWPLLLYIKFCANSTTKNKLRKKSAAICEVPVPICNICFI